jgi:TRAP-type C4-dicarboxylate transport system substrate-binding protein
MVNLKFWNTLPPDLQKTFIQVWDETVTKQRQIARKEQADARKFMEGKGVEIFDPSDEEMAKMRKHILPVQDKMSQDLKHDPALVQMAKKALGI